MTNLSGRLTMYDFLGILTPGIVVVYGLLHMYYPCIMKSKAAQVLCCGAIKESSTLEVTCQIIIFFALSYIIGLVINWLSDGVWSHFRNNSDFMKLQFRRIINRGNGSYRIIEDAFNIQPDKGCCCDKIFSWYSDMILAYIRLILCLPFAWARVQFNKYPEIEKLYYRAYYWLAKEKKLSSAVVVLESQVSFLRNMLVPLVLWCLYPCGIGVPPCVRICLTVATFLVMVSRQNRVYALVAEDYQWYKDLACKK